MQVILGSGGAVANELARVLPEYTDRIRLVSRNPVKINEGDELFKGDLTDERDAKKAVEGAEVAYLTVGLPYRKKVWAALWPMVMENVIKACQKNDVKLVFFDNIYMYDRNHLSPMDENTPIRPTSKKGEVRRDIADMLLRSIDKGRVNALIARCADYYGPGIERNGMLNEMMFKPLHQGKKASWLSSMKHKHSITYVPDAAKATAILGNTDEAYGQVWHLPTADEPPTGKEWLEMIAGEMNKKPSAQVANRLIIRLMGMSNPILGEVREMMYQYDRDYVFDSSKFNRKFNFTPTSYSDGIKEVVEKDYS